jgi:hypothetical protein
MDGSRPGRWRDSHALIDVTSGPELILIIRPIPGGHRTTGRVIKRLFHWCRMPCSEMKDLEAIHNSRRALRWSGVESADNARFERGLQGTAALSDTQLGEGAFARSDLGWAVVAPSPVHRPIGNFAHSPN